MRMIAIAAAFVAAASLGARSARADSKTIDLRTKDGLQAVKGEWRYSDVKVVEVTGKAPDGKPNKTYNIDPDAKAARADYDDSKWTVIAPETLKDRRSTGQVCFCWYRTKVTIPAEAAGKRVFFQTTVDDYGEVWVDGLLPRIPGAVVTGFNKPNRVELKDPQPGKVYQIAVFGMNGPISAAPSNYIFLHNALLEFEGK